MTGDYSYSYTSDPTEYSYTYTSDPTEYSYYYTTTSDPTYTYYTTDGAAGDGGMYYYSDDGYEYSYGDG